MMNVTDLWLTLVIAMSSSTLHIVVSGKQEGRCVSTLGDIKEAYFKEHHPYDKKHLIYSFFAMKGRYFRVRNGLTMGFYHLTYKSEKRISDNNSESSQQCCHPQADDNMNRCLVVIVFHSVAYMFFHPLLLSLFAFPYNPRYLLFDGGHHNTYIDLTLTSQVNCWSLLPVCDNISNSIAEALTAFTIQASIIQKLLQ